ncbi:MAG TPA: hypothetical protein VFV33_02335, partial [Gemmatimonadaceae bacterium]|nr:hypothetical protein [Gemmatimonadaceae bacterium]
MNDGRRTGEPAPARDGREPEPVPAEALREAAASELASRLPSAYLEEHGLVPLEIAADGSLVVAAGRAPDVTVTDELARVYARPVRVVEASPADVQAALLGTRRDMAGAAGDDAGVAAGDAGLGDLRAQANDAPVV